MKKHSCLAVVASILFLFAACNPIFPTSDPDEKEQEEQKDDEEKDNEKEGEDDTRTPDQKRDLAYLFDLSAVPQITITLTEEDWNQYLKNFDENPSNGLYVPARFTFQKGSDRYERDSVGLRPRGNTSRRRPEGEPGQMHLRQGADWHHAHFGIRFTEYDTGERFFGMDRIVLKWFNNDPSYCREVFCYDLFHRFDVWSAPHASYCRLYIQIEGDSSPAYFGVYEMVEGVRKGWMDHRRKEGKLPDSDGNLWKAAYNGSGIADLSDFDRTGTSKMGVSDDWTDYSYALKTHKKTGLEAAKQELYDFIENDMRYLPSGSSELQEYLTAHMDVDLFLRALAVNVAVGMWDDYWVNGNNYYFYFDSNHRFYFIPYDYDNTLGTNSLIDNAGTHNPLYWGSRDGDRLLVKKVLSIAAYEDTYKQYLRQIVSDRELMEPSAAIARVRGFQSLIGDYVENDTGEDMQIQDSPAWWGNIDYKLLSGDNQGTDGSNFFRTKALAVGQMQ